MAYTKSQRPMSRLVPAQISLATSRSYDTLLRDVSALLDEARRLAARSVNTIITATYWEIGHRIVEYEQRGARRAAYGEALLQRLAADLTRQFGRGFSERNLEQMRLFYLGWPISQTPSAKSRPASTPCFPLSWSHYVRLLSVEEPQARAFYEAEAMRGGWSVRQLDRQIATLFYERTALSRRKAALLRKGAKPQPGESPSAEEEIKDPFVLEFLGLKDEYSEHALEEALIHHLEHFLLELGNDFTFVARQKRLRVGEEWYRIDLVFFHRRLRCLILIDLKIGKFTHADAGQMNLYLNYAKEHWMHTDEHPPIGLILCAKHDDAVAHYALGGLSHKVFASRYKLRLPAPEVLRREIHAEQRRLEQHLGVS